MPSIWSYCDPVDRGYGIFKRRIFKELEHLGWETVLAQAPLLESKSKRILQESLQRRKWDWMLFINQSASQFYEYLEITDFKLYQASNKIIWYLDDPFFFVDRPFEKNEYVFSFDETYVDPLKEWQPGGYGFLPLAADLLEAGRNEPHFACDICFVGGVIDQSMRRNQLPDEMRIYIDQIVSLKLEQREKSFFELVQEHPISPGKAIHMTPAVAHYLYWEANNRYRIGILESLKDLDLRIYGNEDWSLLLQESPLLQKFYGPADPITELPQIFASAKIHLNLHSIQCQGSLNQRDFNAPVAGGFLLSDWVPSAGKYFYPGEEAIYWYSEEDLRAKVMYYLEQEQEREGVIDRGRRRVLQNHTYAQRVKDLLAVLREVGAIK